MPSFDVVNKVDMQEVDNAVNITKKTIAARYDFKDSDTDINLDRKQLQVNISTENTMRLAGMLGMVPSTPGASRVATKASRAAATHAGSSTASC